MAFMPWISEPAHGRRRLHDLLRHRRRDVVLHQPQRPAVHAHAPRAPAVDLHRVHPRPRAHPGADGGRFPGRLPLGPGRLPGRQPAHRRHPQSRRHAVLRPASSACSGTGADDVDARLRHPGDVHGDLVLLPQAERPVLPAALPGHRGGRPLHGGQLALAAALHRRHGVPHGLAAVALRQAQRARDAQAHGRRARPPTSWRSTASCSCSSASTCRW